MPNLFAKVLCLLVVVGFVALPASATTYTFTGYQEFNVFDVQKDEYNDVTSVSFDKSADGKAITLIHFKVPMDHTVSFTVYYGTGSTVSGSAATAWNTSLLPLQTTTSTITFDGVTKEYSFLDTNPEFDYFLSGYATSSDNETGLIVYNAGYGSYDNDLAVFKAISNPAANLIYRVDMSSDTKFDCDISYGSQADVASSVSKDIFGVAAEWIAYALSLAGVVLGFLVMLFEIIKFFFIDNLWLTIALYFSVSMAYAAISSRDIFGFYRKFIGFQRAMIAFMVELWNYFVAILSSFRGIFRI